MPKLTPAAYGISQGRFNRVMAGGYEARREARRLACLEAMAALPDGMGPRSAAGLDVGTLLGLCRDGLAEELPERDRLGDRRFRLTDAGRVFLETTA